MAKYTSEEKLQAVLRYLEGNESSLEIAQSIGTDHKAILKWVKQYQLSNASKFLLKKALQEQLSLQSSNISFDKFSKYLIPCKRLI